MTKVITEITNFSLDAAKLGRHSRDQPPNIRTQLCSVSCVFQEIYLQVLGQCDVYHIYILAGLDCCVLLMSMLLLLRLSLCSLLLTLVPLLPVFHCAFMIFFVLAVAIDARCSFSIGRFLYLFVLGNFYHGSLIHVRIISKSP